MVRQVEYKLNAEEIRCAIVEYIRNVEGEGDKFISYWMNVPNSADQETVTAIVRFGVEK